MLTFMGNISCAVVLPSVVESLHPGSPALGAFIVLVGKRAFLSADHPACR